MAQADVQFTEEHLTMRISQLNMISRLCFRWQIAERTPTRHSFLCEFEREGKENIEIVSSHQIKASSTSIMNFYCLFHYVIIQNDKAMSTFRRVSKN
jgi:hypothetical protein